MIRVMEQERQVQAVQRLFVAHTSILKGFILGLLPDHNRAEDVLQEVFLTLTQKADEFTPGTDFTAWARAVARIKVLHRYDQDKRAPRALCAEALDALVAAAPAMDESRSSRRQALNKCLEQVAPTARKILDLRYDENLAPPEIARRLSWTVDAVHVGLAKVRKFLRECSQRRLETQGA